MKRLVYLVFAVFLAASCEWTLSELDPPKDLIPRDEMVEIMTDMLILEGHIQKVYGTVNRYYKVMSASGKAYLKDRGISEDTYERSYTYYNSNREMYLEMLGEVEEKLLSESYQNKK